MEEVYCDDCGWEGDSADLINDTCPKCEAGDSEIRDEFGETFFEEDYGETSDWDDEDEF